ncbi:tobH protein [Rhodococcus sp. X156]|uniref:tobH protein n=1 Tax=Rhodococcus sp. X156 TaxID=2499145 RepID=UPI000FD747CD|nr:tobH protein [Rhodococcus sp. X156]
MTASGAAARALAPADLDDTERLLAADADGRLRGAASAGASVRAVAAAVAEGALARLQGASVRSVVLLAPRGPARHAAEWLQALCGDSSTVPVVVAAQAPRWVGALDVVVVLSDDPGDQQLAESVGRVVGRGAELVLAAPEEGLLAPAAAGRALLLPPRLPLPQGMGLFRFAAVGLAVLSALRVLAGPDLEALADELDAEAGRNQPGTEVFANPAKLLALRCAGHRLVVAAEHPAAVVLAGHVATSLLRNAAVVVGAAELAQVLLSRRHGPAAVATPVVDPIFHDPDIDGPLPEPPLRVLLLGTAEEETRLRALSESLPDVELVLGTLDDGPLRHHPAAELLLLAARCETAAVYLGLAS